MAPGITLFTIAYIIILILPGVLFKRYYYYGRFAKQYSAGLFADRLLTTLLWGIIIQVFCTIAYCALLGVSFDSMIKKLGDLYHMMVNNRFPPISWTDFRLVLGYVGGTLLIAIFSGFALRFFVRKLKLDLRAQNFRLTDHWYYLFSGEMYAFEYRGRKTNIEVLEKIVDVLVKEHDGRYNMYSGLFHYYECNSAGELETICLKNVQKCSTNSPELIGEEVEKSDEIDGSDSKKWHDVPGHHFVLPYSNVLNLNIEYIVAARTKSPHFFRNKLTYNILTIGLFLFILYNWFVPWFYDIPLKNKIYGFLFSHLVAIFGSTLVNHVSNPDEKYRLGFFIFLIFCGIFIWLVYMYLRQHQLIYPILDIFRLIQI